MDTHAITGIVDGTQLADKTESIRTVGLLLPIVVTDAGILDGRIRFAAAQRAGIVPETVHLDAPPADPVVAAALYRARTQHGIAGGKPATRKTSERVLQVVDYAADPTLPAEIRQLAADGIASIRSGAFQPTTVLRQVREAIERHDYVSRYPDLAGFDRQQGLRIAAHLDTLPASQVEAELSTVRSLGQPTDQQQAALKLYRSITQLEAALDGFDAGVFEELAAARDALTPQLRAKCRRVADVMDRTARRIRDELETVC